MASVSITTVTGSAGAIVPAVRQDYACRWPQMPSAPPSDARDLAERWLKDGDWSAFMPLCDALRDRGRDADAKALRESVALACAGRFGFGGPMEHGYLQITLGDHWRAAAMRVLWFDLFDEAACVAKLAEGGA